MISTLAFSFIITSTFANDNGFCFGCVLVQVDSQVVENKRH